MYCLALVMAVYWWMQHIHQSDPTVKIILVSEDPHLLSLAKEYDIIAYSLREYLLNYFKDNTTLLDLYESLAQSVSGEDTTSEDILPTTFEEVSLSHITHHTSMIFSYFHIDTLSKCHTESKCFFVFSLWSYFLLTIL
jgi:hypothetical protein